MSTLEIFATIFTLLSVFLAVKLKTTQYPVGIIGTILYFFVFWDIKLYFSAYLQVFFTVVQFYGWYYWNYGNKGAEPLITEVSNRDYWSTVVFGTTVFALATIGIAEHFGAVSAVWDSLIFGLSVIAQWYLDRKKMQTWLTWSFVNVISIGVYYSQGLMLTTGIYLVLLCNTLWGYLSWKKEFKLQK